MADFREGDQYNMATAVGKPPDSGETGLTFLRPLPGSVPQDSDLELSRVAGDERGLSNSQLVQRLFPDAAAESQGTLPVTGLELGHFVLEERIGRGGMGAVFRAIDRGLDRVVALKVLSPEQSSDHAAVLRFQNEARAAARLDHNNIARVHYIGRERGLHFIAFEFVVGTNVRELILQKGRLAPADAVNYTLQVVDALRHTSAASVVHRDIKPSNIIVTPTGRAKLVDLGLARQIQSGSVDELTMAGTALGTFDYISPEQAIDARNVDVRSDIYSLGCTLYHMLTGEPPYPRGSMFEKVMHHHRSAPPDPSLRNPEVPPELAQIVQKMMASNPDDRYASPDLLSQDLMQVARMLGIQPAQLDAPVWVLPPYTVQRRGWDGLQTWMMVAVVLLGAVILVDRIPWSTEGPSGTVPGPQATSPLNVLTQPSASGSAAPPDSPAIVAPVERPSPSAQNEPAAASADLLSGARQAIAEWWRLEPSMALADTSASGASEGTLDRMVGPGPDLTPRVTPPGDSSSIGSPAASAAPAAPVDPFVIVAMADQAEEAFPTLAEACLRAPDDAVIELRFDGRLPRPQPPLRITGKRLRIRPAGNFRPVLSFAVDSSSAPLSRTAAMLSVGGGSLEMHNVDLEMRVDPRSVVDQWTLISCSGVSELILTGVSMTIHNPDLLPAAFIEFPNREGAALAEAMTEKMFRDPLQLRVENSIVRGQGDLIVQRSAEPLRIQLTDVAAAISGTGLRLDGQQIYSMAMRDDDQEISMDLQHVSLIAEQGLVTADSGDHGRFLPLFIDARNCIFSVPQQGHPLITFVGHEEFDELRDRLTWNRHRDGNFLELTGPVWRIRSPLSEFLDGRDYSLSDWMDHWGPTNDRQVQTGLFRNPRIGTADTLHRTDRSDFVLRSGETVPNPAVGSSSDRRDAGVDWSQSLLPKRFPEISPLER